MKEVIIYNNIKWTRYCEKGYYVSKYGNLLHRYVWIKNNGVIEKGHIIHHKDRNVANNDISNLELLTYKEHYHIHNAFKRKILS